MAIWPAPHLASPTPEDLLRIARLLDPRADAADDFQVADTRPIGGTIRLDEPRPLGLALGDVGLDERDLARVAELVGFTPANAVHGFALANLELDHRVLGELALFVAREFKGLVDFGGNLGTFVRPQGEIVSLPYNGSTLREVFHVADADFLAWWLRQPDFHMIK